MILQDHQIQKLVDLLRGRINPHAIYLFGSQAGGVASEHDSDVDLCIIVPDEKEPYRETVDAYETLQDMPFPKDIIVRRRSRFEERSTWPASLEHEVKRSGRLIYSA